MSPVGERHGRDGWKGGAHGEVMWRVRHTNVLSGGVCGGVWWWCVVVVVCGGGGVWWWWWGGVVMCGGVCGGVCGDVCVC
jgi:hypothetical protein